MSPSRQLGLLWGGVAVAVVAMSPLLREFATALPACPVRSWLDLPCPTCGTTRAALALARFDVVGALSVSPLAAFGWIGLIGGGWAAGALALLDRAPDLRLRPTPALRLLALLGIAANWVYLFVVGT